MATATLPDIHEKTATTRSRPKSGGNSAFPRIRKFSHESPGRLKQLEHGFVLDGVALSRVANEETDRSNPSVNIGIPQYNPVDDKHCKSYFKQKSLPREMSKIGSAGERKSSMAGNLFDDFVQTTEAWQYLESRQKIGAGYTRRIFGGHTSVPTDPSKIGYHGEEGYRKNTPDLRKRTSVFDYEDPFDNPQPLTTTRFPRTLSAPATMRLMRQKSATVYRSNPGGGSVVPVRIPGGRRTYSAMPRTNMVKGPPPTTRELATGPMF